MVLGLLFAAVVAALLLLPVQSLVRDALAWTETNRETAWALFMLMYIVCCVCFLPGLPLTLAAGAVFGLGLGTVLVSIGSTIGAFCAFWVGRTFARGWVAHKLEAWPRFHALDRAVEARGFWIVLLTRLSPAFPFFMVNYAFGLTAVRQAPYFFGTWIGMLPATVAYVYAGSLAANVTQALAGKSSLGSTGWLLLGVGLVATVTATLIVTRTARGFLERELAAGERTMPPAG